MSINKSFLFLSFVFLINTFFLSNVALATHESKKTINKLTAPVGKIYQKGDNIPKPAVAVVAEVSEPRSGESIYTSKCAMCHASVGLGAPVLGNVEDWAPRTAKGIDTLLANAKSGINAMPPMGMCTDCSDDELKSTIEHMLSKSQ